MGRQLLIFLSFSVVVMNMIAGASSDNSTTSESGLFRQVSESFSGYDTLSAEIKDARSLTTCAASCLQTDDCTGFVFDHNATLCELITEYCGGLTFKPTEGQLYTRKGSCTEASGYHYVDIGIECEFCIRVSNESEPALTFDDARDACTADGGSLLHFEDLRSPDFQDLLELSETTEFLDSYWIGINSLNTPGQLAWDNSNMTLTDTELNVLELYESPSDVGPVCIYMSSFFQEYYMSNCSVPRGYICRIDT